MADKLVNGVDVGALGEAIHTFRSDPPLGRFQFRATNTWQTGGYSQTTISGFYGAGEEHSSEQRPFRLSADEPALLLGEDRGPNPVEHLLNALAACVTSAMVYHSAARGLRLSRVQSTLEGELDIRGFMGITDEVRRGYQNIRISFQVEGDGTPEQLKQLCEYSPVLDVVRHGTQVAIEVEKVGASAAASAESGAAAQP